MAAALECWSSRVTTDDDMVEQVLMRTNDRSEETSSSSASAPDKLEAPSTMHKRFLRLSRNVSEAIASLKNSLNLDSSPRDQPPPVSVHPASSKVETCRKVVWGTVVRNLTQLYPGSQLPEKLVSNIRKHYDSLPLRSSCLTCSLFILSILGYSENARKSNTCLKVVSFQH